jgi:hypothetical protein
VPAEPRSAAELPAADTPGDETPVPTVRVPTIASVDTSTCRVWVVEPSGVNTRTVTPAPVVRTESLVSEPGLPELEAKPALPLTACPGLGVGTGAPAGPAAEGAPAVATCEVWELLAGARR